MRRKNSGKAFVERSSKFAFFEKFEVPDAQHPSRNYLTRWRLIQTPWFGILLHRMDGPDGSRSLHDHPWPFFSIILRGGYDEAVSYNTPLRRVTHLNYKSTTDLHCIRKLLRQPTWTLVFTGKRVRKWGFVDEDPMQPDSLGFWVPFDEHESAVDFDRAMEWRKRNKKAPVDAGETW